MIIRQCLRAFQQNPLRPLRSPVSRRLASTSTPPLTIRLSRLESRLPRFLRHITTPLRTAPLSHITAFLLLHELTAILPLLALATAFHQYDYLPPYISEGKWVKEGTVKFGGYMKRKGWIGEEGSWWGTGEGAVRVVVEIATAWAVVKLLLPVRLVVSVWGTPWFARWTVVPVGAWVGRVLGRGRGKVGSGRGSSAAGTGAVGGGVGPREGVKRPHALRPVGQNFGAHAREWTLLPEDRQTHKAEHWRLGTSPRAGTFRVTQAKICHLGVGTLVFNELSRGTNLAAELCKAIANDAELALLPHRGSNAPSVDTIVRRHYEKYGRNALYMGRRAGL